ncbi:tagaturonate reductase [Megasphaera sp. An286]|uniref:tagaturonate reductase n=1 Tax=Megasphaera sp. An286 TaxID=1965622 RepID=UPI000B3BBD9A|nr:tagaturonate reductase [Megasphaera sp. An286]OUO46337.1 altronate oxidoreductase [Megasphaera sp. An286]
MKNVSELYTRPSRPVKILQFGEGVFLRAFADYAVDIANEENNFNGNIAVILPRSGKTDRFAKQNNIYTVCLRGQQDGQVYKENRVITSIDSVISARDEYDAFMALAHEDALEFVISNTTDAGIAYNEADQFSDCPPSTFPAKLTKFLYERYTYYQGDMQKGLVMVPTELNDDNGQLLKSCVLQYAALWNLDDAFTAWLASACRFVDTLVDRIVAGYPAGNIDAIQEELGYEDALLDQAEPFSLWVIGDPSLADKFTIGSDKFHVEFTDNIQAFKEQKVRILNGAHTSMVLGAYLSGLDYVGQCMADPVVRRSLDQTVFGEIVPTVDLPREKAEAFAKAVYERFENPFVNHALLAISLNSISKWKGRVLPTFKDSVAATGKLPKWLTYSLAALLAFYRSTEEGDGCLIGSRAAGNTYEIHDDAAKLAFIKENAAKPTAEYVQAVMSRSDFWGEDLTAIAGFADAVAAHIDRMAEVGVKAHIEELGRDA